MTYRFVTIGDLHLAPGPRNADRLAALDYIIQDAVLKSRTPVDAWFCAGDLNDARMSIDDRNALVRRAIDMANIAPVVVVYGNHDAPGDLDFLRRLKARYPIAVVSTPEIVTVQFASQAPSLALFCLPYPSKARLVAAGTPAEEIPNAVTQALDVIFMDAATQLADARMRGMLTGCIGHVTIAGAVASTGQPQIGTELEITEAHLTRLGDCFKVFGHIHKHQRVGSAVYAGSICRMDFGEVESKGYLEISCETSAHTWRFVPIPVPPLYHVEGILTRDRFDWRVTKGPNGPRDDPPASWEGIDLRVRASYPQQERDVLAGAKERVAAIFAGARRFEFEPIAVPERALRAPAVVMAQTLDAKLRAWATLAGVTWSDRIDACAQRLQSTDVADVVINDVHAWLDDLMKGGDARKSVTGVHLQCDGTSEPPSPRVSAGGRASGDDDHATVRDTLF